MKTHFECYPCFLKQTLSAAKVANLDKQQTKDAIEKTVALLHGLNLELPPPLTGRDIHNIIKEISKKSDPYRDIKKIQTKTALELLPQLRADIKTAGDPFENAVKFSIAGNAIDLGTTTDISPDVKESFKSAMKKEIDKNAVNQLKTGIDQAERILFLADNAGEIVFDVPLMEYIGKKKLSVAVRSRPIINDATLKEAKESRITQKFRVIENGSDLPGTWYDLCNDQFKHEFDNADLIISKGQGNYETLSSQNRSVFYLFLVKCAVIAKDIGQKAGTFIIKKI